MKKGADMRIAALRRFAIAITVLTLLGHIFLGFEQSWAHVLVALLTGYSLEIILEWIDAQTHNRTPRFSGGLINLLDFLLPVHIGSLAIAMLIYPNAQLMPIAFAVSVLVGSKYLFRVNTTRGSRHFLNPSNTGIAATLVLFPWVGISPPYQFTENLYGGWDWFLPALIIVSGSFLNYKFTKRMPLILSWLAGFAVFAMIRASVFDITLVSALIPMTGTAFVLFTFYMVSDPGTTPFNQRSQIFFGLGVAAAYQILMTLHIVFGLFFALVIVCSIRGAYLQWAAIQERKADMIKASAALSQEASS
jgi:hypothetical protein